jgi:hypothetical protein
MREVPRQSREKLASLSFLRERFVEGKGVVDFGTYKFVGFSW